jgi:hypothetical protein
MARQAKAIPKAHREDGVWCVLDLDGQHRLVEEFEALEARYTAGDRLTSAEVARRDELRSALDDLLIAKVLPMSGAQFDEVQGAKLSSSIKVSAGGRGGAKVTTPNVQAITNQLALDMIETQVVEIRGYSKTVAKRVNAETGEVLESETAPIATGAEAAAFFRSEECADSEREVADALFGLITRQSQLEAGLGKWLASRRASSPATTRRTDGGALAAIPTTSTPA